jgi:two-component system chemotaxis response regulator CheY
MRILVVDDQPSLRQLTCSALRAAGFNGLTSASDGEEAWTMLERSPFDIVITDVEMPRLGGIDLLRRIREDERFSTLPVILLTGQRSASIVEAASNLGANGFIIKPANATTIERHIRFAVRHAASRISGAV